MPPSRRALARAACAALALSATCSAGSAVAEEAEGFHFGSYGRVRAATDLRGGGPQYSNFVAHGSRLDLDPYLELELRNTQFPEKDLRVRVVSTLAVAGDPFHYTGEWEANTAMRNMFVDVRGVGTKSLSLWVGAKMYRGDDIYLLDFWPLDNLNTVGGGASIDVGTGTRVQVHAGTNRLLGSAFQYQETQVPSRSQFGSQTAVTLDRPRTIGSAKITQYLNGFDAPQGMKVSLYGEGHYLPSGTEQTSTNKDTPERQLPSDTGFVLGAQATGYGFGDRDGHAHLFLRYARGIAAYGDLAVPTAFDTDKRASSASELLVATAGNVEFDRFALLMGAYARHFQDGTTAEYSTNNYWEGIFSLRPQLFTTEHTGVGLEASYQFKNRKILDDEGRHRVPAAWRVSVLPMITPMGWGSYKRPILYAVYTATFRNKAAQEFYPEQDPRAERSMEHYLGLHAEWWFNSSSYP